MLLVVEYAAQIRIYENINDTFYTFQNITPADGSSRTEGGAIADDHQWLVFGTSIGTVYVYKFNGS